MASLDAVTTELAGIAAAVAGRCRPCLEYHLAEARRLETSEAQLRETARLAEAISRAGDKHTRDFAGKLMGAAVAARPK
jgi:AhpD family alkylhydroperoxidase